MSGSIIFTGGGTAGHVFPALAVVDELTRQRPGRVVWIGSVKGIERRLLAHRRNLAYYGIPSGKLRRYFSMRNFFDLFAIAAGVAASLVIMLRERPRLVFSKGGYVSVPPVLAAALLKVPVFTHESDANPGLATRINTRFAEKVLVSFRESLCHFEASAEESGRVAWTGNPVRPELLRGDAREGRRLVGCPEGTRLLLVLGGSLGSARINRLVLDSLESLSGAGFVVHQMGAENYREIQRPGYHGAPFFGEELAHLLKAADLVVSRAGANILWELAALGKPALLIPLSREASRGDQIENAEVFARAGAAEVLPEEEAAPEHFLRLVLRLLENPQELQRMGQNARALGRPDSAAVIAGLILDRTEVRVGR